MVESWSMRRIFYHFQKGGVVSEGFALRAIYLGSHPLGQIDTFLFRAVIIWRSLLTNDPASLDHRFKRFLKSLPLLSAIPHMRRMGNIWSDAHHLLGRRQTRRFIFTMAKAGV